MMTDGGADGLTVLGVDTALGGCGAAVVVGGGAGAPRLLAERSEPGARGAAQALIPTISAALDAAGMSLAGIDRLAGTVGPGFYTGLRVGLSTVRGIALARARPAVGVTTLAAVAADAAAAAPEMRDGTAGLLVVLPTRRRDYYIQLFALDGATALAAPAALAPAAVPAYVTAAGADPGAVVLAGAAASALTGEPDLAVLAERPVLTTAAAGLVAPATVARLGAAAAPPSAPPAPLYLRPPDVTPPKGP